MKVFHFDLQTLLIIRCIVQVHLFMWSLDCCFSLHVITWLPGPDLGLVWPQATVILPGVPTAPYPNYINNFITILLKAFRVIVILQPFNFFFINLGGPFSPGAPQKLLLLLLCKSATGDYCLFLFMGSRDYSTAGFYRCSFICSRRPNTWSRLLWLGFHRPIMDARRIDVSHIALRLSQG